MGLQRVGGAGGGDAVCACTFSLVCYRDCARFTLCAIGMCAKGTWAIGNCVQFLVCYRVGALSHRALTDPALLITFSLPHVTLASLLYIHTSIHTGARARVYVCMYDIYVCVYVCVCVCVYSFFRIMRAKI